MPVQSFCQESLSLLFLTPLALQGSSTMRKQTSSLCSRSSLLPPGNNGLSHITAL